MHNMPKGLQPSVSFSTIAGSAVLQLSGLNCESLFCVTTAYKRDKYDGYLLQSVMLYAEEYEGVRLLHPGLTAHIKVSEIGVVVSSLPTVAV